MTFVRRAVVSSIAGALASVVAVGVAAPREAHAADVSSWLSFGGGYGLERDGVAKQTDRATAFSTTIGVGSTPNAKVVVGGVFRTVTFFSLGTDISLGPRFATGGFARGQWGFAVDAGVVGRFWNDGDYGRWPLQGIVTLGAPWGFQLGVGAQFLKAGGNDPSGAGGFAVLEIDLLRLTLMRKGATDQVWFNASPAGGRDLTH